MFRLKFIKLSEDCIKNDHIINKFIYDMKSIDHRVRFYPTLCKPSPCGEFFMIAYDIPVKNEVMGLEGKENSVEDIEIIVRETSVDEKVAQTHINTLLDEMRLTQIPYAFVNIYNIRENMYILVFEKNKLGKIPSIFITPSSSTYTSVSPVTEQLMQETFELYGSVPYASTFCGNNKIIFLI